MLAMAAIIPAILWPERNTATRLNSVASTEHVILSVELSIMGQMFFREKFRDLPEDCHHDGDDK